MPDTRSANPGGTNTAGLDPQTGQATVAPTPDPNKAASDPNKAASDPSGQLYAGTPYAADGTDMAAYMKGADARDFMYGRDPNYATNTAAAERTQAAAFSQSLQDQGQAASGTGATLGAGMAGYGQQAGADISGYGQTVAAGLGAHANDAIWNGQQMQGRAGAQADYQPANNQYANAQMDAAQLAQMQQGPSAAQAQLQSGLNQSQASNLALARSGHGFGSSAAALSQAAGANAAAGQQATNASAQLSAQETAAWNAQHAQNLTGAAGITSGVGQALQSQGLSQAQLQQQTTAENDQAQAALTGQGLTAYGKAGDLGLSGMTSGGQLGLSGLTSGANATQAGETLGLQGTQAAAGTYAQGEQMAGINMTAQQQGDLTREQGLIQKQGIDAGVAAGNQAALNSGWGTALSTAATIGGIAATESDANAKQSIQPLDQPFTGLGGGGTAPMPPPGAPKPIAAGPDGSAPPVQPAKGGGNQLAASGIQAGGAVAGAALGTAIAPGVGTVLGGLAGSVVGKGLGSLVSSDIHGKDSLQSLDAAPAGPMGYGQVDPGGSTRAGMSNAYGSGRDEAAKSQQADADLKSQAKAAAVQSMVGDAATGFSNFARSNQESVPSAGQFQAMGQGGFQPAYGMGWGQLQPGAITSDAHSKTAIRRLTAENDTLRSALAPAQSITAYPPDTPGPTMEMLNQAAADQDAAPTRGQQIVYPASRPGPTAEQLNQAAQPSAALDMVDKAPGYSYEYKEPDRHGYGQKFGPMAQDLLKTPAGASTVERAPDGTLAVNTGRLALAQHAALHSDRVQNAARFDQLKNEIDAMKSGSNVASNEGLEERYGSPSAPADGGHFWEVPDYSNEGRPTPFWSLPSAPYAPAQRLRQAGSQIGRG